MGRELSAREHTDEERRLRKAEQDLNAMRTMLKKLEEDVQQLGRRREQDQRQRDAERHAAERNAELERRLRRITGVLHATLTSPHPTCADVWAARPRTERSLEDGVPPAPRRSAFGPEHVGNFGRFIPGRREEVEQADARYGAALREHNRRADEIRRRNEQLVDAENAAHRAAVDELDAAAQRRDPGAVEQLAADLLRVCEPLRGLLHDIRGHYDRATGELVVAVDLAEGDLVPVERDHRVDRRRHRVTAEPRPDDEVARMYSDLAGQVALAIAATCLRSLDESVLDAVRVRAGRPGTCLVEVVVPRAKFGPMDAAWPTPDRWLREFGAVVSPVVHDPADR